MSDRNRGDPGGSGEYRFYSSREERLAGREEPVRETGSVFRRNRSLLIILLDIVIVLLMFVLYLLFFQPETGVQVGQYSIEGTGFFFDDELYLTVTIELDPDREAASGEASLVEAEFPDGVVLTDVLPSSSEFETVVRHVVPAEEAGTEAGDDVVVDLRLLGQDAAVPISVSR